MAKKTAKRRVPPPLEMDNFQVKLTAPNLPPLCFTPRITHKIDSAAAFHFGDIPFIEHTIDHTFDLVACPDRLELFGGTSRKTRPRDPAVPWRSLEPLAVNSEHKRRFRQRSEYPGRELVLATVKVNEFVARCAPINGGWIEWLSLEGLPGGELEEFIGMVDEGGLETALMDGSLFYLRAVHVHPCIRGQRVGLRLIAQAVAMLWRSGCDLVVGEVNPISSPFEGDGDGREEIKRDTEARGRLVRYYSELGFTVWKPDRVRPPGEAVLIYHSLALLPYLNVKLPDALRC